MRSFLDRADEVESAFDDPAFAALKRHGAPSFIVEFAPLRAIWANAAATALFGADDCEDLERRFLGPKTALARQIEALIRCLEPGVAARLQRLRFVQGFASRNLTFLCRRLPGPLGVARLALAVVARGAVGPSEPHRSAWEDATSAPATTNIAPVASELAAAVTPGADRPSEPADAERAETTGTDPAEAERTETEAADPVEAQRTRLRAAFEGVERWRFLWRADPSGRLVQIDGSLFDRLDAGIRPAVQRSFAECVAAFDPEGAQGLRTALARRKTWSGLKIHWPISDGRVAVPITLGASPQFDSGRQFEGFRGFGVIDVARVHLTPELIEDRAPEPRSAPISGLRSTRTDPPAEQDAAGTAAPNAPLESTLPEGQAGAPEVQPPESRTGAAETGAAETGVVATDGAPAPMSPPNVVRLWPLQTAVLGRPPVNAGEASATDGGLGAATGGGADSAPGGTDADVSCLAHDPEHNGSLSSSEHFAFQEIARALGAKIEQAKLSMETRDASEAEPASSSRSGLAEADHHPGSGRPKPEEPDDMLRLRALLDAAGDAIAAIDETGRVLTLNRQGERWFGQDRRQLARESFTLLLAPESRALAASLLAEVRAGPESSAEASRELVVRTPEGWSMPVSMTLAGIGGGLFSAVWRDLSTVKRLERELVRAEREAERATGQQPDFLAKVDHEIRTPLNAILGFAEIMMDESFGPLGNARYKDYLQDIHASGTHVMSLINDLLNLSRIEHGRLDLDLGSVEINKVIGDCVAQMQPQAHRERVIVRTSLGARLPAVTADERSVRQIVTNLLSNAVKFNEPGGQVIVSTALSDAGAVVARIRDTGVGMSDADIAAALEPFRQLAPSKQTGGTGLGLPLTKALVGANGASLSIRSRPHEGTLVEVMFMPAALPAARVPA